MSVSKNSVVKSVLCPAMDWADWDVLFLLSQILVAAVQDILCLLGQAVLTFSLMRGFRGDCVDRLLLFAASVFSVFSDCESLAFAVRDFIYAILNSFFLLGQRICL